MEQRYQIFYPVYIDSQVTYRMGRRVPEYAAVESPEVKEIAEILTEMGYDVRIEEDKAYSRDFTMVGRVAFNFKVNGKATQNISAKKQLFIEVGKTLKEKRLTKEVAKM